MIDAYSELLTRSVWYVYKHYIDMTSQGSTPLQQWRHVSLFPFPGHHYTESKLSLLSVMKVWRKKSDSPAGERTRDPLD